ncbi:siderophore-interacting protein [Geodermatophilus sp. URMC 63]
MTVRSSAVPQWRFFRARVAGVRRVGADVVRLTLTGEELTGFGFAGDDQRIKLLLPHEDDATGSGLEQLLRSTGHWLTRHGALPAGRRPYLRTYTVRTARPERAELDLDVVLHGLADGQAGPGCRWAAGAVPGDPVVLLGPDRPGSGRAWGCEWAPPSTARSLLLAGDETAVPAVSAILEALDPASRTVTALLEVPTAADVQALASTGAVTVRWLPRDGRAHGDRLVPAVRKALAEMRIGSATPGQEPGDVDGAVLWDVPDQVGDSSGYVWLAGEAGMVAQLRRSLVRDLGVPRDAVAFMGYWRRGCADR